MGPPSGAVYAAGAEAAPTAFVRADALDEERGPRLAARYFAGEDGTRELHAIFDRDRDAECGAVEIGSDLRCAPSYGELAVTGQFSDATCTEEVATSIWTIIGCPAPTLALRESTDVSPCGALAGDLFELGAPLDPTTLYTKGDACTSSGPIDGASYYALGAPVDPERFAKVVGGEGGTGALLVDTVASEDGRPLSLPKLFRDRTRGPCQPQPFEDGTRRCLPLLVPSLGFVHVFADAACAGPELMEIGSTFCPEYVPQEAIRWSDGACPSVTEVRAVGEPVDVTTVYYQFDGSPGCSASGPQPGATYHAMGATIPNPFPVVTEILE